MKQHVPRWTTSNAMVQAAYDTYFASMKEGMIVLAHSQGGAFCPGGGKKAWGKYPGCDHAGKFL